MKRDPALVTLSRDHHQALRVAQKLRRATTDTAAGARSAFMSYWEQHGRAHFRLEEDVLFPAYAMHADPHHRLVARALCDQAAIRARADALGVDHAPDVAVLHELGTSLADHVRLEERELFPLVEAALPAARLAAVAAALEQAGPCAAQGAATDQPHSAATRPGSRPRTAAEGPGRSSS